MWKKTLYFTVLILNFCLLAWISGLLSEQQGIMLVNVAFKQEKATWETLRMIGKHMDIDCIPLAVTDNALATHDGRSLQVRRFECTTPSLEPLGSVLVEGSGLLDIDFVNETAAIAIEEATANILFQDGHALGKHLTLEGRTYTVKGVYKSYYPMVLRTERYSVCVPMQTTQALYRTVYLWVRAIPGTEAFVKQELQHFLQTYASRSDKGLVDFQIQDIHNLARTVNQGIRWGTWAFFLYMVWMLLQRLSLRKSVSWAIFIGLAVIAGRFFMLSFPLPEAILPYRLADLDTLWHYLIDYVLESNRQMVIPLQAHAVVKSLKDYSNICIFASFFLGWISSWGAGKRKASKNTGEETHE